MPSLPRLSPGLFHIFFAFLIAMPFSLTGVAQDSSPKSVEKTAEKIPEKSATPVFPSAVAAPVQPEASTTPPASTNTPTDEPDSNLKLGAGDLLSVSVYNVPELETKSRVGSNGDIYLPLIDYVHLAGLTVEEAQRLIEKRLSDGSFVKNPHVTLFVNESASQGINVLGEITRPGVYPVVGDPHLFDMVSLAGGFTEKAGQSITVTHRNQTGNPVTVPLTRKMSDTPANNIAVFPGDTIVVHKADVVYVVGDVGRPSGFLMDTENLTVLKAIALAGGTNRTAKLNGAKIIRKGAGGMTETPVELKKMLSAKAPDIPMQGDDILFVPSSSSKVVMSRTVDVAVQAATAVGIVAIRP
jgi:polysaccharide biosynthesis/export protein